MWLYIAILICDSAIAFTSMKLWGAINDRKRLHAVGWGVLLDVAIGVSAMGFVSQGWWALIPSIIGGSIGTFTGLPRRKE